MHLLRLILSLSSIAHISQGYVDFGDLTKIKPSPTPAVSIPRPHQLPEQWQMHYASAPRYPLITAIAPFLQIGENGMHTVSWSTAHHHYSRHFQNARGIFRRQDGVFRNDTALLATCTPCVGDGSGSNRTVMNKCNPITNTGVLREPTSTNTGTLCYGANYSGALEPFSVSTGLPCCPSCVPRSNATATIVSGVLATSSAANTTAAMTTTFTMHSRTTVTVTGTSTATMIAQNSTTTSTVTLSVTTITPATSSALESPIVTVMPNQLTGCGTASGSGTVVGSGTVFIGPGGIFPVTSSGTVSGFASKVIGCGTIIATSGSFEGSATITGCGTGTGCAVLTGSGTVYPDLLGGLVGIASSGVVSGCGKVVGCGMLVGSGTFILSAPYTTTITPPAPRSTVNVYISYCPPDPAALFQMGSNVNVNVTDQPINPIDAGPSAHLHGYNAISPSSFNSSTTSLNGNVITNKNGTDAFSNPLCQLCPNDSGICCPLYAACGVDGHCPYTALRAAGYLRFGVNVVACANSSEGLGMVQVEGRIAPGPPAASGPVIGDACGVWEEKGVVRRKEYRFRHGRGYVHRHGHGHGHGHFRRRERGL